ncbi:unnamed protein product [Pipistrellus nathusii]|uniref:Uncharacterized protein n=1 Tax=Pipistrellus nathusii TaxID=59473 RepID=A0ABN9Z9B5_PIPNA
MLAIYICSFKKYIFIDFQEEGRGRDRNTNNEKGSLISCLLLPPTVTEFTGDQKMHRSTGKAIYFQMFQGGCFSPNYEQANMEEAFPLIPFGFFVPRIWDGISRLFAGSAKSPMCWGWGHEATSKGLAWRQC